MKHDVIELYAPLGEQKKWHQTVEEETKKRAASLWTERSQEIIARLNYTIHNACLFPTENSPQKSCIVSRVVGRTVHSLTYSYVYYFGIYLLWHHYNFVFFYLLTWPQPISEIHFVTIWSFIIFVLYSRIDISLVSFCLLSNTSVVRKRVVFVSLILIWFTISDQYTGLNRASITGLIHWQRRVSPGLKMASEESYWNAIVMVNTSPKGCSLLVYD